MKMRDRMLAATADLPTTAEMKGVEVAYPPRDPSLPERDPDRPRTAVGAVAALSTAKLRIQELEQALEQKSAAAVVPVDKLVPNPWQPRTRFVEATLRELAANIKEVGLLQPILVRRGKSADGDEEFYELIAGERRWRAHQLNGTAEIKALVTEASDADMAVMAVTENINREDLTDFEISKAMIRAEKEFPDRKRMAEAMGLGRATLYRYLSYSKLPQFMIADLEVAPEALGGNAASDTAAVLKKFSLTGADPAIQELWTQVKSGSLDQSKFAATLEATVTKRQSGSPTVTSQRDIHKVYAGKNQAGSITKDAVTFTLKLKSVMLTPAKEERIRGLIAELYGDAPNS